MGDITFLLKKVSSGDSKALDELMQLVYPNLRRIAASLLQRERAGHTLQPTAVVHELYLKMFQGNSIPDQDRGQFYACAARGIRQLLVDHARKKYAVKRGQGLREEFQEDMAMTFVQMEEILALDEALERLHALDQQQAKILEMFYFTNMKVEEIAEFFQMSARTVQRELHSGRAFLKSHFGVAES